MLINVGLEKTATLKNISGSERLFLPVFWVSNSPRTATQTGQGFSVKVLPSPGINFGDSINAELLGEASASPGCRQGILPGLIPSLAEGSAMGKAFLPLPR